MGWLYQNGPGFCALYPTASSIKIGNTWAFDWLAQIDYRSRIQRPTQTDLHWIQRQAYANCGEIKRNVSFAAQTIITEGTKNILHSHAFDQLERVLPDPKSGSSPLTSKDAPAADTFILHSIILPASHRFGSGGEPYPGLHASHRQYVCNSSHALRNNVADT